jgi:hypothetical protein
MACEQVDLAPTYSETEVVAAGEVRYFPATRKYYQKLRISHQDAVQTGILIPLPPPIGSNVMIPPAAPTESGDWETNVEFWQDVALAYSAEDAAADETPAVGEIRRDPSTDTYYSYYRSLRDSDSYVYYPLPTATEAIGRPAWAGYLSGSSVSRTIFWDSGTSKWYVRQSTTPFYILSSNDNVENPQDASWDLLPGYPSSSFTLELTDESIPDPANWGALTPWAPQITGIHWPRVISRRDPRLGPNSGPYQFEKTSDGVRLVGLTAPPAGRPWCWYRRNTPILTGDEWSPTATYTAAHENDLVFDS